MGTQILHKYNTPQTQYACLFFNYCSHVGTVAAVAALVATIFRPCINVHNLHDKLAQASFVVWEQG